MESRIENEFVPYELALALKELHFDEPCLAWFSETKELQIAPETYKKWTGKPCNNSNIIKVFNVDCISAPTFSQAFRWFREKYGLRIRNYGSINYSGELSEYFEIFKYGYGTSDKSLSIEIGALTYEEAELACLNKLIEIVKL
jgi:hypothetical protein